MKKNEKDILTPILLLLGGDPYLPISLRGAKNYTRKLII